MKIARSEDIFLAALSNVLANTPAIPFGSYSGATIVFPAGYVSTSVEVFAAASEADTFVPLHDASGNAVTFACGASRTVVLPAAVFACRWLKLKTNSDDTTRDVSIVRKA